MILPMKTIILVGIPGVHMYQTSKRHFLTVDAMYKTVKINASHSETLFPSDRIT